MADSGQTDEERRALRTAQRTLARDITSDVGDEMENPDSDGAQ